MKSSWIAALLLFVPVILWADNNMAVPPSQIESAPQIDQQVDQEIGEQQEDQNTCASKLMKQCLKKCEKAGLINCPKLCQKNIDNECKYNAGE